MTRGRTAIACAFGAALLLAGAIWFPVDWASRLPGPVEAPASGAFAVTGATLLRLCLVVDAAALLWLGFRRRGPAPPVVDSGAADAGPPPPGVGERVVVGILAVAALALRLHHADSDLWIDEIVNLELFRTMPPLHVLAAFSIANNHPLSTLLVKAMSAVAGDREWALRLPAILFGAATVPALWAAARRALGAAGAVAAALLLAVSYHHIFYSQNARGYSAHLFFAVAAAGLLSRAMRAEGAGRWVAYVASLVAGVAVILHGFFVMAGHALALAADALLGGRTLRASRRREGARAVAVAAWTGLHLLALAIPDAVRSIGGVYHSKAMGYRLLSMEHLQELTRGLSAGAGAGGALAALVFLALGAAGFLRAYRADRLAVGALVGPLVVMAAFVVAGGLNVTPRTFLIALPLGIVCGIASVQAAADAVAARRPPERRGRTAALIVGLVVAVLTAASLSSLPGYYAAPKQDFRGAIRYVLSERRPGDRVLAVYLSRIGVRHYGPGLGLVEGRDFTSVHSAEEIDAEKVLHPGARLFAIVTLPRANRLEYPDLAARLGTFRVLRTFRGTLGDGDVSVLVEDP